MKNFFVVALFLVPILGQAQAKEDIFNSNVPLVFLGADFTNVKFTKADEFTNKPEILRFFVDINNQMKLKIFMISLNKRMGRDEIKADFSYVTRNNAAVNWQSVYSDDIEYLIPDDVIKDMVLKLNPDRELYKNHIGMVLCQENYCKTKPLGSVAIVFFRVNDLETLLISHRSAKPVGFGFLKYWSVINGFTIGDLGKIEKELK